ncbi:MULTISPECIES: toprim domain-containing protein [Archaeoglobus]|jgi:5S rRNA maturation endonuclease (ribonuclease M5)|uniref:UPF0292 protein AF_0905 n=3 Tax=Archaeoglobus fulgidus TaxID=2234 RepID=Y905_ARCFU|nr:MULTISPECIES: toprim domain-containing protein [Archaeoglobus]O29357.1 RecName: Full=UPF0292 protein AF_0905 [Archaeoglobus fulgidus DSM 4304]AAB90335.1 conserved hypothetical protein [Archaeoglobus fulgidus DSM 4304]AIG97776.1 Small primase-like protein (Toprim domain protein) [Archaeoglobus fulgidus DSM 8774]KUJ93196.1 MAG: UPF0292 protein [Archaeoglobus fulgidus]KUK05740.1 MAG: hypothetical protein XD48_2027 [Archaeoglobus fulgidus]MDI3498098.1 hypothetical protein [Archaeoglobus sp.]
MEDYKPFFEAIDELKEKSENGWVVVVEGKKDVRSLRAIGVSGEIVVFTGYASTADTLKDRKVIILTDSDAKGMEIEKGLVEALKTYGKIPDVEIKRKIFSNVRKEISKVEEISAFYEKISGIEL